MKRFLKKAAAVMTAAVMGVSLAACGSGTASAGGEGSAAAGGESAAAFRSRCCAAFGHAVRLCIRDKIARAAFVAHGGTLMAILERYANAREAQSFYAWQAAPLCGWAAKTTSDAWIREQALFDIQPIGG